MDDASRNLPTGPHGISPRRAVPPLSALRAFDAVARLGGVRKAAEALAIDHSTISRHLRTLEAWTGATLIEPTGRGIKLTDDGWRYHREVAAGIDIIAAATMGLMRQNDEGRLNIWCVPGFAFQWLTPRLDQFRASKPGLEIGLRPSEAAPNLSGREADLDIRCVPPDATPPEYSPGIRVLEFARIPVFPVASPDFLRRTPPIRRWADLLDHPLIQEGSFEDWRCWLASRGVRDAPEVAGARLWHGHLAMEAARRGHGIALGSHFLVHDDLQAGRLVEVTAADDRASPTLYCTYLLATHADRWAESSIARFRNWLVGLVNAELGLDAARKMDKLVLPTHQSRHGIHLTPGALAK